MNRIDELIDRMTLEEKLGQLNQAFASLDRMNEVRDETRRGQVGSRILASNGLAGTVDQFVTDVEENNEVQRLAVENSRLGIPLINGRDIIHGHRTIFPIPLAQAASWNPDLVEKISVISAKEAKTYGVHWTFSPMLDIARDPRWGRVIEGYGEDPYLVSCFAKAAVQGYQSENIAACAKHFIAYGGAEGGRDYNTVECTDNTLWNIYLRPFKAAVDAGVHTVMCGFHEIGGTPVSSSKKLLTDLLKKELGFKGFVISDWASVEMLQYHRIAENAQVAAEKAFNAGVDMDMADFCFRDYLISLVNSNQVSLERVNDAVSRILKVKEAIGLFENPYTEKVDVEKVYLLPEYRRVAQKIAEESMVLLKNGNQALPLSEKEQIGFVGPFIDEKRALLGSWTMDGKSEDVISIREGVNKQVPRAKVVFADNLENDIYIGIRGCEKVVVAIGESHLNTGESANVASIELPVAQVELIKKIKQLNKTVVVVICAGRPYALTEIEPFADAILYAWHPGVEAGNAIIRLLYGLTIPSGRLPITFPRTTGQIPIYYNHKINGKGFDEYFQIGNSQHYQDCLGTPLYPFGYGLSYSSFTYEQFKIDKEVVGLSECLKASVCVTNTGDYEAKETIQCYIQDCFSEATRPLKELINFRKITFRPGETKEIVFKIQADTLAYYNQALQFVTEPGKFKVWIGNNCLTKEYKEFYVV